VTTQPGITKDQYQMLYTHPEHMPKEVKNMLALMVHHNVTIMTIISKYPRNAPETSALIKTLKTLKLSDDLTMSVTGSAVSTMDVLNSIFDTFLYAVLLIVGLNYLIMLCLLRSLILPLKAIFMTTLSLFASYGVLVFIIQYGHGHQFLHFDPQKMLDISMVIIIFCALFGVSMDYEVFLLSRIKERYEISHSTNESIIYGIDHSSKIITSAAIILILICMVFMTADIIIVKAFGLGIAVAVFIDAFLIRIILVPATMAILKSWNWYLPKWLDKVLPEISFKPLHHHVEVPEEKSSTSTMSNH
jgi:RND superfamily putative drug exporter